MISDEELCRQVQQGSEAAMEALVHRYHRQIFAYHYRLSGHLHTAEDLTQETFMRFMSRIDSYHFPQPFSPWVYTIAHNLFKDWCRSSQQRAVPAPEPLHPPSSTVVDISEHIASSAEVSAALRQLDDEHRETVVLRFYHDLKVDQIARTIGVPPGTVKSRLFTAVRKLRELLLNERRDLHAARPGRPRP